MSNYNRNGGIDPNDIASLVQNVVNSVAGAIGTAASDVASSFGKSKSYFNDLHLNTDFPGSDSAKQSEKKESKEQPKKEYNYSYSYKASAENKAKKTNKTNAEIKHRGMHPIAKYAIAALLGFGAVITFTAAFGMVTPYIVFAVSALLFVGGVGFLAGGVHSDNIYLLANRYHRAVGTDAATSVVELASRLNKKPKKVRRELQSLIDAGYFGSEAYIDLGKDCFVKSPSAFAEQQKNSSKKANEENKNEKTAEPSDEYDKWLFRIAEASKKIEDTSVSRRADAIGMYTSKIFEYVKSHPEAAGQIRTFMNYYLPLTLKLLQSYDMIEEAGVAGDNMRETKENIESTLDTLRGAYRKELDTLYTSEAMDISSDIDVLEEMLRRDGLSDEEGAQL